MAGGCLFLTICFFALKIHCVVYATVKLCKLNPENEEYSSIRKLNIKAIGGGLEFILLGIGWIYFSKLLLNPGQ